MEDEIKCQQLVQKLKGVVSKAKELEERRGRTWWHQKVKTGAKRLANNKTFQLLFAFVILLSFILAVAAAELNPEPGSALNIFFTTMDLVFTVLFTAELLVSLAAFLFSEFFQDPWHVFDLLVVIGSWFGTFADSVPALYPLRIIRILRAVKVLKSFRSLRAIVEATIASTIPVANSFLLLGLVTCIYGGPSLLPSSCFSPSLHPSLSLSRHWLPDVSIFSYASGESLRLS